ncbi:MAG: hypothetical protein ACREIA_08960 [Opitutaceae bacterium]
MPYALLGLTLAGGYLTKAVMMPVAFLFLGVSLFVGGRWRAAIRGVVVASVVFGLAASPFIMALSLSKGRFTYGDTGNSKLRALHLDAVQ